MPIDICRYANAGTCTGTLHISVELVELVDLEESKLFICTPKNDIFNNKWDHKFSTDKGELGWFQLLGVDWGITNKQTLYSKWNKVRNLICFMFFCFIQHGYEMIK